MKKLMLVFELILISSVILKAQEADKGFDVKADIYSNYVWRGSRFGAGPHIQPAVKYNIGGLTAGVWGSFNTSGYSEADPYLVYTFPVGISFGITDYYYPDLNISDVSEESGSHALEINAGFTGKGLNLGANYIINKAGGAGSNGGDVYFQAGYEFPMVSLFAGAGNGWHTSNGKFNFCNIGIGTKKVIGITDRFSIPLSGQVILNPEKEHLYLVVGISF